jgi:hypothetical protein
MIAGSFGRIGLRSKSENGHPARRLTIEAAIQPLTRRQEHRSRRDAGERPGHGREYTSLADATAITLIPITVPYSETANSRTAARPPTHAAMAHRTDPCTRHRPGASPQPLGHPYGNPRASLPRRNSRCPVTRNISLNISQPMLQLRAARRFPSRTG